jgi:hypothetical protein
MLINVLKYAIREIENVELLDKNTWFGFFSIELCTLYYFPFIFVFLLSIITIVVM